MIGILIATPYGIRSRLFIKTIAGALNGKEAIAFLKGLKRHMKDRKLLMIWDGLPAHRAKEVAAYAKTQTSWLRIERFPGYAPELNPIEYCWSAMRAKHLSNLRAEGMQGLGSAVRKAKFAMNDSDLLKGFLKASDLY